MTPFSEILEEYILNDKISDLIALLKNVFRLYRHENEDSNEEVKELNHQFLIQAARYRHLTKQIHGGSISNQDASVQKSIILQSFLNFFGEIELCHHFSTIANKNIQQILLWENIVKQNNSRAYNEFVNQYPNSLFSEEAKTILQQIAENEASKIKIEETEKTTKQENEEVAWHNCLTSNTIIAYQTFFEKFPNSIYIEQAKANIINIKQKNLPPQTEIPSNSATASKENPKFMIWKKSLTSEWFTFFKTYLNISGDFSESDLEKIFSLPKLDCSNSKINTLLPLSLLTNLRMLQCNATQIKDLTPLQELTNLNGLILSFTPVTNLEPIIKLKNLTKLDISDTLVYSLEQLKNLENLQVLNCSNTPIENLNVLSGLPSLHTLMCYGTNISSIAPIMKLPKLKRLYLSTNKISSDEIDYLSLCNPICDIVAYS